MRVATLARGGGPEAERAAEVDRAVDLLAADRPPIAAVKEAAMTAAKEAGYGLLIRLAKSAKLDKF